MAAALSVRGRPTCAGATPRQPNHLPPPQGVRERACPLRPVHRRRQPPPRAPTGRDARWPRCCTRWFAPTSSAGSDGEAVFHPALDQDQPDVIESVAVETPQLDGPFGARGVGEHPMISVAPIDNWITKTPNKSCKK